MKQKIKTIISSVFFLILLFFSIYKCSNLLEYKRAQRKYNDFFESETNFDVIFLGTSNIYNSVFPQALWKEYGISSYNLGYANTTIPINYYLLKEVVKYTNPKLIVLDLYGLTEYEKFGNGKYKDTTIQHVQFDSLPLSINKIQAVSDIFDDYKYNEEFIWNLILYHNRWDEINKEDFELMKSTQKGSSLLTGVGSYENFKLISKDETTEIDTVCYQYLLKILEYCEENNIELLLTYIPTPADETKQRVANSIYKDIESYEHINYINMLHEGIVNYKTDLDKDNLHFNFSGAMKVTSWLGDYIINNYELDDYSNSESWKKDFEEYKQFKIDTLNSQNQLVNTLMLLNDPGYDVLIEIKNNKVLNDKTTLNLLENLGISVNEINKNSRFFLIEEGGNNTSIMEDFDEDERIKINLDDDKIRVYKKDNNYNIYLNDELLSYDEIDKNIGIIVLDSESHNVLTILEY